MLAKVVKSNSVLEVMPFSFPKLGEVSSNSNGVNQFVLPDISELQTIKAVLNAGEMGEIEPKNAFAAAPNVEDILQNAHTEAAQIIAQAEQHSAIIAQAAEEKAVLEVQARFDEEVSAKADELRGELTETIEKVSSLAEDISNRHEKDIVELALQIAKKIVAREVTIDREIAFTLVKVSLGKLHNRSAAEVHLNPEDFAFVQAHREKLDFRGALELVEDRSVGLGGCLIHTETGDIDARIESQFDEIAHGLFN